MTWTPMPHRGLLAIHGPDRRTFLDALISQSLRKLEGQPLIYGLFLNPQGRFLHDLFIFEAGETLYLDIERDRAADLLMRLQLYKLRAQVQLENLSEKAAIFCHPDRDALFPGALSASPDPRSSELGARAVVFQAPPVEANLAAYHQRRIPLGIPEGSWDMPISKAIPLECHLDVCNAIDFDKGCYLGQELTTRTKHRGLVRKHLVPIAYSGAEIPFGTEILQAGDVQGDVRFSAPGTATDWIALALLYDTALEQPAPFETPTGQRLTPLMQAS